MLLSGALWAETEQLVGAIRQIESDIPTGSPRLVCCVVKPLPISLHIKRRVYVEVTVTFIATEEEHQISVTAIRLMNVKLSFGHNVRVPRIALSHIYTFYAMMSFTTCPSTSVRRKSRPA